MGQTKLKKMVAKYEHLEEVGFELYPRLHRKEREETTKILYDNSLEKDKDEMQKILSLKDSHLRILNFKILRISENANILTAIADFCRNKDADGEISCENIPFEMIAFDTLEMVIEVAETYKDKLAKDAMVNLFVFGFYPNFFIARVCKGKDGVTAFVGKKNFDLPLKKSGDHRIFGKVS